MTAFLIVESISWDCHGQAQQRSALGVLVESNDHSAGLGLEQFVVEALRSGDGVVAFGEHTSFAAEEQWDFGSLAEKDVTLFAQH